jgi:hypothetical protein
MLKNRIVVLFFYIAFTSICYSQSKTNLKEINQVWFKFYQAFETLNYEPMAEIHSKKLIRISGGQRIYDYNTYINNYKTRFKNSKQNNVTNKIILRFLERINNDSTASERGIYKLIVNQGKPTEKSYFGKFHVLFVKENNTWKILMDYDSTEGNTIGEDDFLKAYAIDNFNYFIKE